MVPEPIIPRKPHPLSKEPHLRGCTQLWHSQAHRCSDNQRIVQARVDGHRGTLGTRIPPCPGSPTSGSETITEDKDRSGIQCGQQTPDFWKKKEGCCPGRPWNLLPSSRIPVSCTLHLSSPRAAALSPGMLVTPSHSLQRPWRLSYFHFQLPSVPSLQFSIPFLCRTWCNLPIESSF